MSKKKKGKAYKKKSTMKRLLKPTATQLYHQLVDFPIIESLILKNWQTSGLAHVILVREQPDGKLAFADFLVDIYCLGVKDCFMHVKQPKLVYQKFIEETAFKLGSFVDCPVDLAHAIIYGAVEYAQSLGFSPHPDFERDRLILEPIEKFETLPAVSFGQNGKPCYISGPSDDIDFVIETLQKNVGDGNFDYILDGPEFEL
jgi:hypothetical protein